MQLPTLRVFTHLAVTVALGLAAAGCGSDGPDVRSCTGNDQCLQASEPGICLPSPYSVQSFCAFPDVSCDSGQRWGLLSGDGLGSVCVAQGNPADASAIDARPGTADASIGVADASHVDAAPDAQLACGDPVEVGHVAIEYGGEDYQVFDLAVESDVLYVSTLVGYFAYTTADPTQLAEVGRYIPEGNLYSVLPYGAMLYAAVDAGIVALDNSSPSMPLEVGSTDSGNIAAERIAIRGSVAYTVGRTGMGRFTIYTTGQTSSYRRDLEGTFSAIQIVGHLAFVADTSFGLRVFDLTAGTPQEVGAFQTPGGANGLHIVGDLAFVADASAGLRIVDVSNPASMNGIGHLDMLFGPLDVVVIDELAFLAAREGGVRIVDISSPSLPVEVGVIDTPGTVTRLLHHGDYLFVGDNFDGLRIIDLCP